MLRDNIDRLRNESRDERDRRDTRSYYMTDGESDYDRADELNQDFSRERVTENRLQNRGLMRNDFNDQSAELNRGANRFGAEETARRREPETRTNNLQNSSYFNEAQPRRLRDDAANREQRGYQQDASQNYTSDAAHNWSGNRSTTEVAPFYPTSNRIHENPQNERFNESRREINKRDATPQTNRQTQDYQSESREIFVQQPQAHGQSLGARYFSERRPNNQSANAQISAQRRRASGEHARDVMSRNVATVAPHDSAQHAARLMRDCDCGAIPVVDRHGRMIGMVTDRDITVRLVAGGKDPRGAQVQDCMTTQVFACYENDSLDDCVKAMSEHQVRRVAVIDNQNRVVGIISQGDLARHAQNNRNEYDNFTNLLGEISEPTRNPYR